jgi:hypothetical protein
MAKLINMITILMSIFCIIQVVTLMIFSFGMRSPHKSYDFKLDITVAACGIWILYVLVYMVILSIKKLFK